MVQYHRNTTISLRPHNSANFCSVNQTTQNYQCSQKPPHDCFSPPYFWLHHQFLCNCLYQFFFLFVVGTNTLFLEPLEFNSYGNTEYAWNTFAWHWLCVPEVFFNNQQTNCTGTLIHTLQTLSDLGISNTSHQDIFSTPMYLCSNTFTVTTGSPYNTYIFSNITVKTE